MKLLALSGSVLYVEIVNIEPYECRILESILDG